MDNIENYGKGLVGPSPEDSNPKRFQLLSLGELEIAGSNKSVFDTSFGLKNPPNENQQSSEACTWYAFCYYFWQWTGIQLSRQDGYSRTHLDGGGGYIIDPFRTLMEGALGGSFAGQGCFTRDQHADPVKPTEANMRVIVNLPGQKRKIFKLRFWNVEGGYNNIELYALAAKTYKGAVHGVWGTNKGWSDKNHPVPPKQGETGIWGHALYTKDAGYDRNMEAIFDKSSWCSPSHDTHKLTKDYFTSGNVFSPIVMEVKEINDMDRVLFVSSNGKYGFISINDGRIVGGAFAANPDELKVLNKVFEYPKQVVNSDGSFIPVDAKLDYIN